MRCICITESPACRSHSSLSNAVGATLCGRPFCFRNTKRTIRELSLRVGTYYASFRFLK